MFNTFCSEFRAIHRKCVKVLYSLTGHRWQYNRAHVFCVTVTAVRIQTDRQTDTQSYCSVQTVIALLEGLRNGTECYGILTAAVATVHFYIQQYNYYQYGTGSQCCDIKILQYNKGYGTALSVTAY